MVGIANILALSKLTNDTPDAVRKAATLMIVGSKNPLINGIASANIVEEATASAVEATSAKAATAKAEKKVVDLESQIETIRPLVTAVADKTLDKPKTATPENDGYMQMVSALKADTTVETVMQKLQTSSMDETDFDQLTADDVSPEGDEAIGAMASAVLSVKNSANNDLSDKQKRIARTVFDKMLALPASQLEGLDSFDALKTAIRKNR